MICTIGKQMHRYVVKHESMSAQENTIVIKVQFSFRQYSITRITRNCRQMALVRRVQILRRDDKIFPVRMIEIIRIRVCEFHFYLGSDQAITQLILSYLLTVLYERVSSLENCLNPSFDSQRNCIDIDYKIKTFVENVINKMAATIKLFYTGPIKTLFINLHRFLAKTLMSSKIFSQQFISQSGWMFYDTFKISSRYQNVSNKKASRV